MLPTTTAGPSPSSTPSLSSSSPPLTTASLSPLLHSLTHSLTLSQSFLSSTSLSLSPSLSLPLDSTLRSLSLSLARLLSLLPLPLQTFALQSVLSIPPPLQFPSSWFLQLLSNSSSSASFLLSFHVSKSSFFLLLQALQLPQTSIPAEHKLGIALFHLAHSAEFSVIARRFGLSSPSLACRTFYEVCHAITTRLNHLIGFDSENISVLTQGFHKFSLPNCCGVIGHTRFSIKNEFLSNSVIAQALVDSNGRFIDLSVGWHGAMNPFQIIPRTSLFKKGQGLIVPPRYILGDSSCPLLPWLITPYKIHSDSPSSHLVFNEVHSHGMEICKEAFMMVKDRWRLLIGCWKEAQSEALPYIVVASCLLHNFLIDCGEPVPEDVELVPKNVLVVHNFKDFEGQGDEGGVRMRDALASHLINVRSHSHFG